MPQKLCARCKADVSGKPRMKDPQGRYFCEDCVKALKAKQSRDSKPAPAPKATGDVMADLVEGAIGHMGEPCEVCQAPMEANAIICTRCGHNRQTGRDVKTRVLAAPKEKKQKSALARPSEPLLENPLFVGGGGFLIFAGLWGGSFVMPELLLISWLFAGVYGTAAFIGLIYYAFVDGEPIWGGLAIASFLVAPIGLAIVYYVLFVCDRPNIKAMNIAAYMMGALVAVGMFMAASEAAAAGGL